MINGRHKARVLWLIKGLGIGGAERLLTSTLPYLDREQFDYEVAYFLPWKDSLVETFQSRGIKVHCLNARGSWDLSAWWRTGELLQRGRYDIVHCHLPIAGIAGRLAARHHRVPVVLYTEHGSWNRLHRLTKLVNRITLGMNHLCIAVSEDVANSMRPHRSPVQIVQNGIDCAGLASAADEATAVRAELGVGADTLLIGSIANLSPVKRHEVLIEAFAKVVAVRPDSALVLVGQTRDRDEHLNKLADQLGIGDKVLILGPKEDAIRYLKAFDVFTISSESEGLPISLLEAMATSRAIVSTRVGGIPEVIRDGVDGLLVPSEDPAALGEAMLRIEADRQFGMRLGNSAQERVRERFDISRTVRTIQELYLSLLDGYRSRHRIPAAS